MDFFDYQDDARKRTKLLVFYYAIAVFLIIAAIYFVLSLGLSYTQPAEESVSNATETYQFWNLQLFLITAFAVGTVIGLGTLYKVSSLSAGGKSVAEMMGGRLISPDTTDSSERRVLNIVEEMAIASGVPVPPVYIMEQEGINAFAAGFNPSDAVIGVTRGCVDSLTRDELQGVIAHEFSHILNGDMRLNIRLIGVLFGIILISFIGSMIFRTMLYSGMGRRRSSRSSGKDSGGRIGIMVFGLCLMVIGAIGVFFGRLIKSAISRQREFLSDASAVQFTRNPAGIAGALKKIAEKTSTVDSVHAEEASHMFFANGLKSSMSGLLATHPPVTERIRRIDPSMLEEGASKTAGRKKKSEVDHSSGAAPGMSGFAGSAAGQTAHMTDRIGTLTPENIAYASSLIKSIPDPLRQSIKKTPGAKAFIFCLLFTGDKTADDKRVTYLRDTIKDPEMVRALKNISPHVKSLQASARMPLVELAMSALQQMGREEYAEFKKAVDYLIAADEKMSIFEFALSRNLVRHLEPVFGRPEKIPTAYRQVKKVVPHCLPLLAILAKYGNETDPKQAEQDYVAGVAKLGLSPESYPMPNIQDDSVKVFESSLDELRKCSGKLKKTIVDGCVAAIMGNRKVTLAESELLRAVADSLNCPMPPLET